MRVFEFRIRGLTTERVQKRPSRWRETGLTLVVLASIFYLVVQLRPALALTPPPEFPAQPLNSSSPTAILLLTNTGLAPLTIENALLEGEQRDDFHLEGGTCVSNTLQPRQNCVLGVSFRPSVEGLRAAELAIFDNAPGSPHVIQLTGTGLTPPPLPTPIAAVYPADYDFGRLEVGNRSELPIVVANEGDGLLHVDSIALGEDAGGVWTPESNDCENRDVAPNDSCRVTIAFAPAAAMPYTAELSVSHNAGEPLRVKLSGQGDPPHGYCCRDGEIGKLKLDAQTCADQGGVFFTDVAVLKERCTPKDDQPPDTPVGLSPGNLGGTPAINLWPCTSVQLAWGPVTDPSSPVTYHVTLQQPDIKLVRMGSDPWTNLRDDEDVHINFLDVTTWVNPAAQKQFAQPERRTLYMAKRKPLASQPTLLRWRVSAKDAAGNESDPSGWHYFVCQEPPRPMRLDVGLVGQGTVRGTGIQCAPQCTGSYAVNAPISLTATAAAGWTFSSWSGDCSGSAACSLTMDMPHSVTATFTQVTSQSVRLTVEVRALPNQCGPTIGIVTSTPSGVNCQINNVDSSCVSTFPFGTMVTLTGTPRSPLSSFEGFSGACSGKPTCTFKITGDSAVTATFCALIP